jgi:hypothetical protein
MSPKKLTVASVIALLVLLGIIVWLLVGEEPQSTMEPDAPIGSDDSDGHVQDSSEPGEPGEQRADEKKAITTSKRRTFPRPPNNIDADARKILLAALLQRLTEDRKDPQTTGSRQGQKATEVNTASPEFRQYIREQIREITPLIKECYEMALEENPDLSGKVTVRFSVIGDPELGGLIRDSSILEETVGSGALNECIRETMYAVKLDPPKEGGVLMISYPFMFRKSDDAQEEQ